LFGGRELQSKAFRQLKQVVNQFTTNTIVGSSLNPSTYGHGTDREVKKFDEFRAVKPNHGGSTSKAVHNLEADLGQAHPSHNP